MENPLGLEWARLPNNLVVGYFKDRTGHKCSVQIAQFYADTPTISLVTGNGSLHLTQEMAGELSFVLGYFTLSGHLPGD